MYIIAKLNEHTNILDGAFYILVVVAIVLTFWRTVLEFPIENTEEE